MSDAQVIADVRARQKKAATYWQNQVRKLRPQGLTMAAKIVATMDVPWLLGEVDRLRAELATLYEAGEAKMVEKLVEETAIRSLAIRNGSMSLELEPSRDIAAAMVGCARTMLGDAPNYTETKVEWDVKVAESPELYTFVVQRHAPGCLTPHEARQAAEAERDRLRAELRLASRELKIHRAEMLVVEAAKAWRKGFPAKEPYGLADPGDTALIVAVDALPGGTWKPAEPWQTPGGLTPEDDPPQEIGDPPEDAETSTGVGTSGVASNETGAAIGATEEPLWRTGPTHESVNAMLRRYLTSSFDFQRAAAFVADDTIKHRLWEEATLAGMCAYLLHWLDGADRVAARLAVDELERFDHDGSDLADWVKGKLPAPAGAGQAGEEVGRG